ncbi:cupin domain-containing protein [Pseudomonas benzenivorans]|uniref:Cupin domain-containing protein n=1 Tax=Pseudomonas benzenivorans TaxID=556533 RepID=A0ABY5HCW3_9PSED|nr:cupin domain-containing protein [Pseudomonas benzenivorans]UTW09184.1 cupin domain-containing protein [Pseudomonas benzenivorans]
MFVRSMMKRLCWGGLMLLALSVSCVLAQTTEEEPAVARAADSEQLQWGACPAFLPEGCAIAVLHGDPAQENLDVFLKLPGHSDIPLHWHTSAERMVLVAGELHVTYAGQSQSVLKPGTYAYGPAKRPHHGRCASAEPCILFIAFESPLDAVPMEASAGQ